MTDCNQEYDVFEDCPVVKIALTDGDRLPEFFYTLVDVDLTGYTIKLNVTRPSGVLTKTAVIVDALTGQFKFAWDVGDIEQGFGQPCLMRAIDPAGKSQTIARFRLDVQKDPEP